jgi:N-6 DNA Methylase
MLCVTNMLLHGIENPSFVRHDNTLARPYISYGAADRVDVVLTNPPVPASQKTHSSERVQKEIFYIGPDQKLRAVAVLGRVDLVNEMAKRAALVMGEARTLFGSLMAGESYPYDVSADGQRFLVAVPPEEDVGQELTVIHVGVSR